MASKNHSDPWRYVCPECRSVTVRTWVTGTPHGKPAVSKYQCQKCGWQGDELLDKKTGRLV